MNEYTSPLTGKVYNIIEVSPMIFSLILSNETYSVEASKIKLELANLGIALRQDNEQLNTTEITAEEKAKVQARITETAKQVQDLQFKLMSVIHVKPSTMCEVLRTFVVELDGKSDAEIMRLGRDFDLLFVQVQTHADKDSDKYNAEMQRLSRGNK